MYIYKSDWILLGGYFRINDALVGSLKIYNLPLSYDLLQINELCTNAWNFSISLPFKNGSAKYV